MGLFYQTFQIGPKDGARLDEITALVDTGSIYTMLPTNQLEGIGIVPETLKSFEMADGREVALGMADVLIRLDRQEHVRICIFGPPDCEPLLGADNPRRLWPDGRPH